MHECGSVEFDLSEQEEVHRCKDMVVEVERYSIAGLHY